MPYAPDLFLGLDSSTQGLTGLLLAVDDRATRVVWEHVVNFDQALPQYGTVHGMLRSDDPAVAVAPPQMWDDALDLLFRALASSAHDLSCLRAVSGCAQQHGSVYLAHDGSFSRPVSPIWMDTSTADECMEITEAVGGAQVLAQRTGSRAFERFAGPQIRKFFETDPHAYAETTRIHLVSSFLASRLTGADAPLDPGDASGMNLMDIATGQWWTDAVEATAPGLAQRLPPIVASTTVIGRLSERWTSMGLPPAAVVVWTGDNPSSLIGTGLVEEGGAAVSLGTSDTIFGVMREPRVDAGGVGHVFGSPTGEWMGITVFKNGSLARERVRDRFGLDWVTFADMLAASPPGNGGRLLFPWFEPEITPTVVSPGVRYVGLAEDDAVGNVRGVIEGQMLAMARHVRWMGVRLQSLRATGGASANRAILQVMADVFGVDVLTGPTGNSACLGSALRAWHAHAASSGRPLLWPEVIAAAPLAPVVAARPDPAAHHTYERLQVHATEAEARLL